MEIIKGIVIEGNKKGRKLGFPTANIEVAGLALDPGIYAGYVIIGQKEYQGAIYLAGNDILETFVFDFEGDLYGTEIIVTIVQRIRDNMDFNSDVEAIAQIAKDIDQIEKCLQEL